MIAKGGFDKTWCRGSTAQQKHQIDFVYLSIYHDLSIRISIEYLWIHFESQNKTCQPYKNVGEPLW